MLILNPNALSAQKPKAIVSTLSNLDFGAIIPYGTGTVTVSNSGVRSATGNIILIGGQTGTPASFVLTATTGSSVSNNGGTYAVNSGPITLTGPGGGSITLALNTSDIYRGWTIPGKGNITLYVGGTLTIGSLTASQMGSYTKTVAIEINFNYY